MSAYFAYDITCNQDQNGFYQLRCILSECEDCNLKPMFSNDDFNNPENVNYFQFEEVDKKGEEKIGKRTVRVQKSESFDDFKSGFDKYSQLYLLHRYECKNYIFLWPQIINASPGYVFHLDYSENISVTPKQ